MIQCYLAVDAVNTSNRREHWAVKAKRAKAHRQGAALTLRPLWRAYGYDAQGCDELLADGLVVELVRVAPRALDDDGNVTSLKAVRDGVADALGLISDRDPRVTWRYSQRDGEPKQRCVEIFVLERSEQ